MAPTSWVAMAARKRKSEETAPAQKRDRKGAARPNILVTGTPGVGKTRAAEAIAARLGLQRLGVSELAKSLKAFEEFDEARADRARPTAHGGQRTTTDDDDTALSRRVPKARPPAYGRNRFLEGPPRDRPDRRSRSGPAPRCSWCGCARSPNRATQARPATD